MMWGLMKMVDRIPNPHPGVLFQVPVYREETFHKRKDAEVYARRFAPGEYAVVRLEGK